MKKMKKMKKMEKMKKSTHKKMRKNQELKNETKQKKRKLFSTRLRASHSLITRADRTNGREMLCSPELHQTTRTRGFSNAPLPCLPCFCCVQARNCSRSNQTNGLCAHMDVTSCDVTSATTQSSSVRVCTSAV